MKTLPCGAGVATGVGKNPGEGSGPKPLLQKGFLVDFKSILKPLGRGARLASGAGGPKGKTAAGHTGGSDLRMHGAKVPGLGVGGLGDGEGAGGGAGGAAGDPAATGEGALDDGLGRRAQRRRMASLDALDSLDPAARVSAHLAPPAGSFAGTAGAAGAAGTTIGAGTPSAGADARARTSLEELLPALVRKVAWSGDGRRGTVRLELGSGGMAGAEILVESDEGRVRVQLRAPAGVDAAAWRARVTGRLQARGLHVDRVEVD